MRMVLRYAFVQTDAYELALNTLGLSPESNNKKVFDHIIMTALQAAKQEVGNDVTKKGNIWAYMQVLYNAGITFILR